MKTKETLQHFTLALFFIAVFAASSNAGDIKYSPVTNREPRISSLGFSIVPPPGENWLEGFSGQSIIYAKKTNPKIQTFITGATEISTSKVFASVEDFLAFVKETKEVNENPTRYQNTKSGYKVDTRLASFCVNYNSTYEDHNAKNLGENQFLLVENHGLICLHPDSLKVGVDVYYSDRSVPSEQNSLFMQEGEAFIRGLKFLPLSQK